MSKFQILLTVTTKSSGLNCREGAGAGYDLVGSFPSGSQVYLIERTDEDWYYVSDGNIEGYASTDYLQEEETLLIVNTQSSPLNCRIGPSADDDVVGSFNRGDEVQLLDIYDDDWVYVTNGTIEGYVSAKYVEYMPVC